MRVASRVKVIPNTVKENAAAVIFFHGTGDTGDGLYNWIKDLKQDFVKPYIKFIFPTSWKIPYTAWKGEPTTVWFDRAALNPKSKEDIKTLDEAGKFVSDLVKEHSYGGIPKNRIILGGFSMGGALALYSAYKYVQDIRGVFALSAFLNEDSVVYKSIKERKTLSKVPLFMSHGDNDDVVPESWGRESFEKLKSLGVPGEYHLLTNSDHEITEGALDELNNWIGKLLG